jgi:hypothetical protein
MSGQPLKYETIVKEDGKLEAPGVKVGDHVEVIVRYKETVAPLNKREGGWAKGKVRILPGFDDPIELGSPS